MIGWNPRNNIPELVSHCKFVELNFEVQVGDVHCTYLRIGKSDRIGVDYAISSFYINDDDNEDLGLHEANSFVEIQNFQIQIDGKSSRSICIGNGIRSWQEAVQFAGWKQ